MLIDSAFMKFFTLFTFFISLVLAPAQLAVTMSPVKVTGQKAIVRLAMKNDFSEKIEFARAVCFLFDAHGSIIGHSTKWVIGGAASDQKPALAPGGTNTYYFVLGISKPLISTNLTAKVSFNRVVIEGGKLADMRKDVQIKNAE
jgi:hypothetical protein